MPEGSKLGAAYVEITGRSEGFSRALDLTESRVDAFGSRLANKLGGIGTAAFSALAGGVTNAGNSIAEAFAHAVKAGSDFNEAVDAAGTQFGDNSKIIIDGAQKMADEFHRSKLDFVEGATRLGVFGTSMGKTEKQAAEFGVTMTKLAAQIGSDKNVDMKDMIANISSGLAGETEPLRKYGLVMSENDVTAAGWAMGLAKVGEELSAQAKVEARAALIQAGFVKSLGNLEKTAGSMANRMAAAKGMVENAWIDIGTALQPAAVRMAEVIGQGMTRAVKYLDASKATFASWADKVAAAFEWSRDAVVGWWPTVERIFGAAKAFAEPMAAAWLENLNAIGGRLTTVGEFLVANMDVVKAWGLAYVQACQTVSGWYGKTADFIGGAIEGIVASYRYWDTVQEDTALRIGQFGTDVAAVFESMHQNAYVFGEWLVEEWPNLFRDAFVGAWSIASNFTRNLLDLLDEIQYCFANGFGDFDTDKLNIFKPGKDFQAQTNAPTWAAVGIDHSATDAAREKLWNGVADKEAERTAPAQPKQEGPKGWLGGLLDEVKTGWGIIITDLVEKGAAEAKAREQGALASKAPGLGEMQVGDPEDRKSQVLKIADLGRKAQESQGKDDVPQKQLKMLENINATLKARDALQPAPRARFS